MLRVRVEPLDRGQAVVRVFGELDLASAGDLRNVLTDLLNTRAATSIGLDLAGLTFIDSTGIGTLVVAARICEQVGVALTTVALSPFAAHVLDVTGVSGLLGVTV